jgi:RNA polymerase-binding transcription factor DksA
MDKNKLLDAYTSLMEHLYEAMDNTLHTIADGLDEAKHKLQGGELGSDYIDQAAHFLKRDLSHAAQRLTGTDGDPSLSEWFKFDIAMLEDFAVESFTSLADKTRLELAHLQQLANTDSYHAGDICAPGTFVCDDCGKEIAFKSASVIPACPACQGITFIRV